MSRHIQFATLELCFAEAIKYDSLKAWRKASFNSYRMAWMRNWLPQCTKHMLVYHCKVRHTLQSVCEDASGYKTPGQWKRKSLNAYRAAIHNGWFDQATAHMELSSLERELNPRNFVVYRILLSDGYFYFGITRNPKIRAWFHRNHWQSSVFQHLRHNPADYKFVVIRDNLGGVEAYTLEKSLISEHLDDPKMLNRNAGGQLGHDVTLAELKNLLK